MKFLLNSLLILCVFMVFGVGFYIKYCENNFDCNASEFCDVLTKQCQCRQGTVKYGIKDVCLAVKKAGEPCLHDVQCHQYKKLGLLCQYNRCVCPRNASPRNGKCPSFGSNLIPKFTSSADKKIQGPKLYSKILLIVGLVSVSAMTLALSCFILKLTCGTRWKQLTTSRTATETETSRILHNTVRVNPFNGERQSRPPSYSSLPPPSYEDVSSGFLPGVTAWWRNLRTVPESDECKPEEEEEEKDERKEDQSNSGEKVTAEVSSQASPTAPPLIENRLDGNTSTISTDKKK